MLKVLVILGSVRCGRMSERVATFVMNRLAAAEGISAELVDLAVLDLPIMEERLGRIDPPPPGVADLGAKIEVADALVIVSPEYNHGYPGVLKNALDYFYAQYKRTPVALVTVSNGGHGGVNAWAQLVTVFVQLGAIVLPATIAVSNVEKTFSPEGEALDPAYVKRTDRMIDDLVWLATRLKD
ncbi:MAG: NAD(P)H-dependent oxidoreductase [Acidimicrobiia bacterium]|nr:NAD(P)H-dependent oxidoreductase [Acidimicrobiia bacterium]